MPLSPILSSLSDIVQDMAEAFAVGRREFLLVNLFIFSFLIMLILPSLLRSVVLFLKRRKQVKRLYEHVTRELALSQEEQSVLEKLACYIRGGRKNKHLLLLKAPVFNGAVKRMLLKEDIPAALLAALRLKLGFVLWARESPVHSTIELPKGLRLYVLPKDGLEFYARIIRQTPSALIVKKEDPAGSLPLELAWVLVFFERTNGIFSFSTRVNKVEDETVIHLAHSEKIIKNQHRRYYRRKILLPVRVRRQGIKQPFRQSTIIDLGGGGVTLLNPENSFTINDRLVLYFTLPTGRRVALTGKVIRSSHSRHKIHLAFEPMNEYLRDSIIGYVLNARMGD